MNDGRRVEFGAVQHEDDKKKFQGRPHSLKAFDEICHFSESQFRYLIGWNRSADPTERVRVICTGNPPTDAEGDWVISFWGPWLDPHHPNPAVSGETRWFASIDGKDVEVPTGNRFEHTFEDGHTETIRPLSRTFIRARVQDNAYYMASNYMATLQSLPEPLRSQMLLGDFTAGHKDDPWQVIPSQWVLASQNRWRERRPGHLDCIGVDVARGGDDKTVLSPRSGNWFGRQDVFPGAETPDSVQVLGLINQAIPPGHRPMIKVDVIGVGSAVFDACGMHGLSAAAMNASHKSVGRDKSGQLGFVNKRAEWYWKLREALDPDSDMEIELPPDRGLFADLTAPRWKPTVRGIQIEDKAEIKARIGRSPDKGDSLVYAFGEPTALPTTRLI